LYFTSMFPDIWFHKFAARNFLQSIDLAYDLGIIICLLF
jgi:hypothetical protein